MANEYRVSWQGFEVFNSGNASVRVSWHGIEIYNSGDAFARVSWHGIEVFQSITVIPQILNKPRDNNTRMILQEENHPFLQPKRRMFYDAPATPPPGISKRPVLYTIT